MEKFWRRFWMEANPEIYNKEVVSVGEKGRPLSSAIELINNSDSLRDFSGDELERLSLISGLANGPGKEVARDRTLDEREARYEFRAAERLADVDVEYRDNIGEEFVGENTAEKNYSRLVEEVTGMKQRDDGRGVLDEVILDNFRLKGRGPDEEIFDDSADIVAANQDKVVAQYGILEPESNLAEEARRAAENQGMEFLDSCEDTINWCRLEYDSADFDYEQVAVPDQYYDGFEPIVDEAVRLSEVERQLDQVPEDEEKIPELTYESGKIADTALLYMVDSGWTATVKYNNNVEEINGGESTLALYQSGDKSAA
jgi:hypothetical protein